MQERGNTKYDDDFSIQIHSTLLHKHLHLRWVDVTRGTLVGSTAAEMAVAAVDVVLLAPAPAGTQERKSPAGRMRLGG